MPSHTGGQFERHRSVLELSTTFEDSELKSAYRRQMLLWHPDRHHGDPVIQLAAVARAQAINAAYEYLSEVLEAGLLHAGHSAYETQHTYEGHRYRPGFPDPSIVEVFLKSSHIVSTGYNRSLRVLFIKFAGGAIYKYSGVPDQVFEEFLAAESHGRYGHRKIYRSYPYVRC